MSAVSWSNLGVQFIVDSCDWVENCSLVTSLVGMVLFAYKYSRLCSFGILFCCANALNLMGNEQIKIMQCYFRYYFIFAYEFLYSIDIKG